MTNTTQTLDASLQNLITMVVAGAEKTGEFVSAEAPILIEQLLAWKFATSLSLCLGSLLLGILFLASFFLAGFKFDLKELACIPLVAWIIMFPVFWCNLDWLKIAIAPKIYLLEYAADLIK